MIRARVRELVGGLDLVERDEFEAVKAMAATARADADALKADLAALRASMAAAPAAVDGAPAASGGVAPIPGVDSAPIV